jgi:hypothetical protein
MNSFTSDIVTAGICKKETFKIVDPVSRIGLVIVHPGNLGEPDGPYPFNPDTRILVRRLNHSNVKNIKPLIIQRLALTERCIIWYR